MKTKTINKYRLVSAVAVILFILAWYLLSDVFQVFRNGMLPGPKTILETFINKLTSKVPDGNTLGGHIMLLS